MDIGQLRLSSVEANLYSGHEEKDVPPLHRRSRSDEEIGNTTSPCQLGGSQHQNRSCQVQADEKHQEMGKECMCVNSTAEFNRMSWSTDPHAALNSPRKQLGITVTPSQCIVSAGMLYKVKGGYVSINSE